MKKSNYKALISMPLSAHLHFWKDLKLYPTSTLSQILITTFSKITSIFAWSEKTDAHRCQMNKKLVQRSSILWIHISMMMVTLTLTSIQWILTKSNNYFRTCLIWLSASTTIANIGRGSCVTHAIMEEVTCKKPQNVLTPTKRIIRTDSVNNAI